MRALLLLSALAVSGCASTVAYGAASLFDATVEQCERAEAAQRDKTHIRGVCDGMYDDLESYVKHARELEIYERGF